MIKTFLRRWFLARNLYYFSNQKPRDWIWQDEFIDYLLNKSHWLLFLKSKTKKTKGFEIIDLIKDFEVETVFSSHIASRGMDTFTRICLGPRGWEVYSWSYLVFHDMANVRLFIIAMIALPGWLFYFNSIWSFIRKVFNL